MYVLTVGTRQAGVPNLDGSGGVIQAFALYLSPSKVSSEQAHPPL